MEGSDMCGLELENDFDEFHGTVNENWSDGKSEGLASDVEDAIYAHMYFNDTQSSSKRISTSAGALPVSAACRSDMRHTSSSPELLSISLVIAGEGNENRRRRRKRRRSKKRLSLPATLHNHSTPPSTTPSAVASKHTNPTTTTSRSSSSSPLEPVKKKPRSDSLVAAQSAAPPQSGQGEGGAGRGGEGTLANGGAVDLRNSQENGSDHTSSTGSDYTYSTTSPSDSGRRRSSDMQLSSVEDGEEEEEEGGGAGSRKGGGEWEVNMKDILGRDRFEQMNPPKKRRSGRYYDLNRKCPNCKQKGHHEAVCPWAKRHLVCYLCSGLHHTSGNCPNDLCRYCFELKHRGRCRAPWAQNRTYCCNRCFMYGHSASICTDLWRQFHNTTYASGFLEVLEAPRQRRSYACCYNCGRSEHFGFECARETYPGCPLPASQLVARYDARVWPSRSYLQLKASGALQLKSRPPLLSLPHKAAPPPCKTDPPRETFSNQSLQSSTQSRSKTVVNEPEFRTRPSNFTRPPQSSLAPPSISLHRHNSLPQSLPVRQVESTARDQAYGNWQERRHSDIPEASGFRPPLRHDDVISLGDGGYGGKWRRVGFPEARRDDLQTPACDFDDLRSQIRHHDDLRPQLHHHHDVRRASEPVASGRDFPREPFASSYDSATSGGHKRQHDFSEDYDLRHSIGPKRTRYDDDLRELHLSSSDYLHQRERSNSLQSHLPLDRRFPPPSLERRYSASPHVFRSSSAAPTLPPPSLLGDPATHCFDGRLPNGRFVSDRGFVSSGLYSDEGADKHRRRSSSRY